MQITRAQLIIFAMFISLTPLTVDMFLPAISAISDSLQVDIEVASSALSVFFTGFAVGQLVAGPLSDRFGRRPLALLGVFLLLLGSIMGLLISDMYGLLLSRLLQAFGVCSMTVSARASINDLLSQREAARFFSLLMVIGGMAPVAAPWVGTWLVSIGGWRSLYLLLIIIASGLFVFAWLRLPESHGGRGDVRENPLYSYGRLLLNPSVMAYIVAGATSLATMFTFFAAGTVLLEDLYQLKPSQFATVFTLNAFILVAGTQLNRMALKRFELRQILSVCSLLVFTLSLFLLLGLPWLSGSLLFLLILVYPITLTIGALQANCLVLAISTDSKRSGSAAALFGATGFAMGALLSWLANWLYDGTVVGFVMVVVACQWVSAGCVRYGNKRFRNQQCVVC